VSIEGRIDINVLFQDKDGQRLKIVSLNDSKEYTTGKVAIVTGTAGTATLSLGNLKSTTYRSASGELVSFNEIDRVAFRFVGEKRVCTVTSQFDDEDYGSTCLVSNGNLAISEVNKSGLAEEADAVYSATIAPIFLGYGLTGTYTIILYGS
jgi:hypothetical protein